MENIQEVSNKKNGNKELFSVTLKNASEISGKIKNINILDIIAELKELQSACSDLKEALGQLNESTK